MIGQTISHYKITAKLGEGGMGIVYKAEDTKLDRPVALKFLAAHLLQDEEANKRFHREAKAAASVHHPNVCPVYEIGEEAGQTFLAMAFIEGDSLDKRIEQGPLKIPEALDIAQQIAKGLEAAHEKHVVHRDIKPGNAMADEKGHVTVMDFGLALLTEGSKLTKFDTTLGTVAYMSPEQAQGMEVDHRTDVWALGCVLYEMVRGGRPFQGVYDQALLYEIVHEEPEPLTSVRTGVPVELELLVNKCLAKGADNRYQTAADLIVDLRTLAEKLKSGRSAARTAMSAPAPREATASDAGAAAPVRAEANAGRNGPGRHAAPWSPRTQAAVWLFTGLMLGATLAGAALWFALSPDTAAPTIPNYSVRQVTFDPGLTYQPALSRDGNILAYSSDRSGEGNLDIWVQQLGGSGEPTCLTNHPADDTEPHFSPDGRTVAFRSERDGGGVYLVPALGGDSRLLVKNGQWPRFSPDGSLVAYWVGPSSRAGIGEIGVVSAVGGEPRRLAADLGPALYPIWSPDGTHLLFAGSRQDLLDWDWWVTSVEGGVTSETTFREVAEKHGLETGTLQFPTPEDWDQAGHVVFSTLSLGLSADTASIWQVPISSETWRVEGAPVRLTRGSGETHASVAADSAIAFGSVARNIDVWSLPIDSDRGRVTGDLERLTTSGAIDFNVSISRNGRLISFASNRTGNLDLWVKDLVKGTLRALTLTPWAEAFAAVSDDGSKVAYTVFESD